MAYDYYSAVEDDVREYINNNIDLDEWKGRKDDLYEYLNDELWTEDSVTGNGSGAYTYNSKEAAEYLGDNLELVKEAFDEFGSDYADFFNKGFEFADVTVRCYVLGSAISKVLEEFDEELEETYDEDEEIDFDED